MKSLTREQWIEHLGSAWGETALGVQFGQEDNFGVSFVGPRGSPSQHNVVIIDVELIVRLGDGVARAFSRPAGMDMKFLEADFERALEVFRYELLLAKIRVRDDAIAWLAPKVPREGEVVA